MSLSDPRFLYWGVSREGGTRLMYTNTPDGGITDENVLEASENAAEKLKALARRMADGHASNPSDQTTT